ncbi:MAG: glycosyl hydrolase family 30, partial [Duncaniella sp.]|nr:glycosyl hydrolase family 30 [Duncaniella sp.]
MNKKTVSLGICAIFTISAFAQRVESYTVTQQNLWEKQRVEVSNNTTSQSIQLNKDDKAQEIKGIGGCFNEMGWDALQLLPLERQTRVIEALFAPDGAAVDYCRMSIGANDFSMSYYSLDDTADDFGLQNFNITRDRYIIIPYIKAAMKVNPSLRIWASPWTPPAWMKTN